MRVPPAQACTRSVQYSFDRSQTPTADSNGGRAALSKGRLASVAVRTPPALAHASPCPRLLLGSSLSTTRMPTKASEPVGEHGDGVRRGWRVRSHLCAQKMAPHVVVVCSTCQPRPAAGDGWTLSISGDKELPHLIQPVAQAWTADRSLVSKRTRQRVCHDGLKSRWYLHSSGEHTVAHGR